MSKAHLQMTDLVSGVAAVAVGRGAGHAAAEMMRLACFGDKHVHGAADEKREQRKTRARREGNLLSFGVQCGGEWLRSLAPMGGTTSLVYLGVRKDGRSGPDFAVSWAQKFN